MPFRNTALLQRSSDIDRNKLKPDSQAPGDGETVLVVETDRSELERMGDMLEAWNYQVELADDGKRALSLARKVRPRLVVTSLELPGLSGVELCQEIRKDAKTADIPCLCVAFPEEIENWEIQTGLFTGEYLQKPVSVRQFKRRINIALKESGSDETQAPVTGDVSVAQIDRYMKEFQQLKTKQQQKTSGKKVTQEKVKQKQVKQKKATQKTSGKKVKQKKVKQKQVQREQVKPVAPPVFAGIDDILEEFALRSSPDAPVPSQESLPEPKYSELDLARVVEQNMEEKEVVPDSEPSDLYNQSQEFVLESIRKADQGEAPDAERGEKLAVSLMKPLDTNLDMLLKAADRDQQFALSSHCVNVAVFGMTMAKTLKCDGETQQKVGLAALLHEIGVVKLPKQLIYKEGSLSRAEVEALRQRPQYSAEILQILGSGYAWLVEIVSQVYERENGAGFPLGLAGSAIAEEAKILGAVDIFEACIHERPYRRAMTGYEAVRQFTSEGTKLFSDRIVKSLMNSFSLYPYNEYVKLNSGEIGQVVEVNHSNLFRPVVRILFDRRGDRVAGMRIADLEENASLFISQAITADALPGSR